MDIETRDKLNLEWTDEKNLCSPFPVSSETWQPDNPENRRVKKTDNTGYVNTDIADTLKRILKEHTLPEEKNMMHYDLAKIKKVYNNDNFKDKLASMAKANDDQVANGGTRWDDFDINAFATEIKEELNINITNPELDSMNTVEEVANFLDERQSQN
tara:strand:+ start:403 stop:873 length:471 start_codon:yes stop_codon:yes gene_type:complete